MFFLAILLGGGLLWGAVRFYGLTRTPTAQIAPLRLSEVQLGMSPAQVQELLGPPEHTQSRQGLGQVPEETWYYGRNQLVFQWQRLTRMNSY